MKISVVIPAYNENENLLELTKRFLKVFGKEKWPSYEFVYVIQGRDGTLELMKNFVREKNLKCIKLLYYPDPIGVGPAFKVGFQNIAEDSTHTVTMDGDLNHQPEELPLFIRKMNETNCDIVIGSRKVKGSTMEGVYPKWKHIASWLANSFVSSLMQLGVKDITSGYRLFKSVVIRSIWRRIKSRNFEVYPEILIQAKKQGYTFENIPITFKYRIKGKSKLNFVNSGFGYLKLILRSIFE